MCDKTGYGVITEQGDLGLGFSPIPENERRIIQENEQIQNSSKDSKDE